MPKLKALETAFLNPTFQDIFLFFWWRARKGSGWCSGSPSEHPALPEKPPQGPHSHGRPGLPARPQPTMRHSAHRPPLGTRGHGTFRSYSPPRPGHSLLKAKWAPHLGHEERGFLMHIFLLRASLDGSLCQAHNQPLQVGPRWQFDGFKIYFPIKLYYTWLMVSLSVSFKKHTAQFALKWKRKSAIGCLTCTVKDLGQVNNDITMGDASGWDGRQIRPVS